MDAQEPQALYRRRLLHEPRRILEVGCGGGGFLRAAASLDAQLIGIDPDAGQIAALRGEGFSVESGRAEQLPYADRSFDAVVFCFSAHHVEDWDRALREALRVGDAVLVLDPWYEVGIPSQAVAAKFDRWSKRIDRATGMVHQDCLDAEALLRPLAGRLDGLELGLEHLLVLRELGAGRMREYAEEQLRKAPQAGPWQDELKALLAEAEAQGFSGEGAILLSLSKTPR